jgi:ABC-type transport system substrate-binding protein
MLLLKDSLAEVAPDVKIKIIEVDTATGLTLYHQDKMQISVGGPFGAWFPDIADPAETVANWATEAGFRGEMAGFRNDTITRIVIEAGSTLNTTRRMELYREIQLEMFRKVPYIFLYNPVALMAERDWVLPPDSPIGRGVYNPEYGDGSGGLQGGYHAYSIWKAETTPGIAIIIGNSPLGAESPFVTTTVFAVCPSRTY